MGSVDFTLATHGFDIHKANAFASDGDPGFQNGKIFMAECAGVKSIPHYRDFMSITPNLYCNAQMETRTYRNVVEYLKASSSSYKLGTSQETDVSISGSGESDDESSSKIKNFGFSAEASSKHSMARDNNWSSTIQAMAGNTAEIVVSQATCITDTVALGSFGRKRFSPAFMRGLKGMYYGIGTQYALTNYTLFVKEFGTHYVRKATYGASLTYQKLYLSRSRSQEQQVARETCNRVSSSNCAGASANGETKNGTKFGFNAQGCMKSSMARSTEIRSAQLEKKSRNLYKPGPLNLTLH
jgi:hypothetical protein